MACCNQRRAAWRTPAAPLRVALDRSLAHAAASAGEPLRYIGSHSQRLRGPSGHIYPVTPGDVVVEVALADVSALLRTGLFVNVGGENDA